MESNKEKKTYQDVLKELKEQLEKQESEEKNYQRIKPNINQQNHTQNGNKN